MNQEMLFQESRRLREKSNCPKAQTGAVVVKNGQILCSGWNTCAPKGFCRNTLIDPCPRIKLPAFTGYEVCHIVHAEVRSVLNIRANRTETEYALCESHLSFTKTLIHKVLTEKELETLNGATIVLSGHWAPCESCKKFAELTGIKEIIVDEKVAEEVKKKYGLK